VALIGVIIILGCNSQDKDEEYVRNREQNIADAIDLLPRLATGIDVNVMFRKCVWVFSLFVSGFGACPCGLYVCSYVHWGIYVAGLMTLSSPENEPYSIFWISHYTMDG
jgi:hypothetical protein